MKAFPKEFVGTWKHAAPWDSDDYLAEYRISLRQGRPAVTALDLNDGERFRISEGVVGWNVVTLQIQDAFHGSRRCKRVQTQEGW